MHRTSYLKMDYFKQNYLNPQDTLKILDIGSFDKTGNYNYGRILNEENWTYHGLDLQEGNNVDIVIENPYEWNEIEDESYDVIVSGQAFEHIEFFWLTMGQIKRVLKPGGICCIIAPSAGPVHRNPYDCWRFNENGMRSLAKYVDFDILESGTNETETENPWHDSFVIAQKPFENTSDELDRRMDKLEDKLDKILELI